MTYLKALFFSTSAMFLVISICCADPNHPVEIKQVETPQEVMTIMDPVTVTGTAEDLISGTSTLSAETLRKLPAKNNNLSDTITVLPRVQAGEEQRTSENAGEILPSKISISGGRAYENNYSVDGINQGSLLDPLTGNNVVESIRNVPSHPQRGFVHQDLIDNVTVYDSNIPARYGRFVGGVIDAETRLPARKFGGALHLRTTQDNWTQFHVDSERRDEFYNSTDQTIQPQFTKYDAGLELDIPINEETGLLGAYKIIQSHLETRNLGDWKDSEKTIENYFIKYAWQPESPFTLQLTAAYTPSNEEFFIEGAKDSDIKIDRGGYNLNSTLSGDLAIGSLEISLAYLYNQNSRSAPQNHYFWPKDTPSKNWGELFGLSYSAEGGYGDIDTEETSLQFGLDMLTKAIETGFLVNTLNFGVGINRDKGEYNRSNITYVHALNRAVKDTSVICAEGDTACIDGEVYFRERRAYGPEDQEESINHYAAYLENRIELGPVTLRPGVRISYDDFMENTDTAHRLAASWDLFQNGRSIFVGGVNRYYGDTLLTFKLREARQPYQRETRTKTSANKLTDWLTDTPGTLINYRYSELDTPYSDEWNIGILQKLFGGTFEINYMERKYRDQFAQELVTEEIGGKTVRSWELNNNGSSDYNSLKLTWGRQWINHYINLNYTYSDQESSNESYDDTFDEEDIEEQVWYDGNVIFKKRLPRNDYYRNHAISVIYIGKLPGGFTLTNVANYLGGYEAVEKVRLSDDEKFARGIPLDLDVYEKNKKTDYWTFDMRLDWETFIYREHLLTFTMEVDNIFDRAPPVAGSDDTYELGRQVWVGVSYQF